MEKDTAKLDLLRSGVPPIREPGVGELLEKALSAGTLELTDDSDLAVSSTDMALICVGTPSSTSGGTDLTAVLSVTRQIAFGAAPHGESVCGCSAQHGATWNDEGLRRSCLDGSFREDHSIQTYRFISTRSFFAKEAPSLTFTSRHLSS